MGETFGSIARGLQDLYVSNLAARQFFDWAAARRNDATETSIDVIEAKSGADRVDCIALARKLEQLSCAQYIVGRRGSKTRLKWSYSLISIGKAAKGESELVDVSAVRDDLEAQNVNYGYSDSPTREIKEGPPLTIAEAKRRLALSLGVDATAIDITIRA